MSKARGPYRVDPLGYKKASEALDRKAENARELGLDYEPEQEKTVCPFCSSEWVTAEQHDRKMDRLDQEPVAYGMWDTMIGYGGRMMMVRLDKGQDGCTVPLYTTPPQRKTLSNEEIYKIYRDCGDLNVKINIARAIEAAHNIKGEA